MNLDRERWDEAVQEHATILEALEARDQDRLGTLLEDHLLNTAGTMKKGLTEGTRLSA